MRKILFTLVVILLFIFSGCSNNIKYNSEEINIPNLKIDCENQSILVEKGGYKWTTKVGLFNEQSVIADSSSPDQIADDMKGNEVQGESELKLDFSKKPNKVTIVDWSETKNNSYTLEDDKIIMPKEIGTYIYEIIGQWDEGQVSYTIKVIVNERNSMTGIYLKTTNGSNIIIDDNNFPIVMSNKTSIENIFDNLESGDKIKISYDLIAESYPGQTKIYSCELLEKGSINDIPKAVLDKLQEMGWINNISIIKIFNGNTGKEITVDDTDDINKIATNLKSINFEKDKSSEEFLGFSFSMRFYDLNEDEIVNLIINSTDTIIYKNYFYKDKNNSIDYDFINSLFTKYSNY